MPLTALLALVLALVMAVPAAAQAPAIADPGPCTAAAALGMPEEGLHDHTELAGHEGLACRMRTTAFLPLDEELAEHEDSTLGEMDAAAGILAVAVQEPVGGALFFDISDPAKPRFLSRFKHAECALGDNCGAYVDLTDDGRYALLSVQQTGAPLPGLLEGNQGTRPGVSVVDIREPERPRLVQEYTTVSLQGVHTARSHVIPSGPNAGEYVYLIQNGVGVEIARMTDTPSGRFMTRVANIATPDAENITSTHDTFTQVDPIDGRVYLYMAGGFTYGFQVYDVSNPALPRFVAKWDLTPECLSDWYAHTIDVTVVDGRRYVTMPSELFELGRQPEEDQAAGCGEVAGNGDKPGPMWIVDATDFGRLATESDDTATVKRKSEAALVTTWTNPAGRAAGRLLFSPHNQQIVGNVIYLSHFHGGVFALDASGAFAGRSERPRELAWAVPFQLPTRPLLEGGAFEHQRADFWDVVHYEGHLLAADIQGGLYSLRADVGGAGGGGGGCTDTAAPGSRLRRSGIRLTRRALRVRGRSSDRGCGGRVARVLVAVALEQKRGTRCRFLDARGRLGGVRSCRRPTLLSARGTRSFSLTLRARRVLPRGRYRVAARAVDAAGNVERLRYVRVRVR